MRRGIVMGLVAALAAIVMVPGAVAATPEEICRDLTDNGRLDGTYTQAELAAFLQSATVQGYCPSRAVVPPPANQGGQQTGQKPANTKVQKPVKAVAGVQSPVQRPQQTPQKSPLAQTRQAGTLPFTGSELVVFTLVGGALLVGGFVLRASARQR
ncbi:MAG TPA: hypothetical protein VNT58_01575 [Gaiellaceae bacterium]|nr:hypothetical protein [Gaiellaceae bacterium]